MDGKFQVKVIDVVEEPWVSGDKSGMNYFAVLKQPHDTLKVKFTKDFKDSICIGKSYIMTIDISRKYLEEKRIVLWNWMIIDLVELS